MAKIKDLGIKVIPETMRPPEAGGGAGCTDCTYQAYSICGGSCLYPTHMGCPVIISHCGSCSFITQPCLCSHLPSLCGLTRFPCGISLTPCGGSIDPTILQQNVLTRENIAMLKDALKQQIAALDEAEKNIGPKTAQDIDTRIEQLNQELNQLKARRKDIK